MNATPTTYRPVLPIFVGDRELPTGFDAAAAGVVTE